MGGLKYPEDYINKVICGDCLELMKGIPDKSIDLVVTDPPYNLNYTGRGKIAKKFANDNLEESQHTEWFTKIVYEFYRILKSNTAIYIYIDYRNYPRIYNIIQQYFVIKNCIVWVKNNFGMGQHYRFQHEFCIYAIKDKHNLRVEKHNLSDVWQFKKDNVNSYQHPTQKPKYAMYKPIEYSSNSNDLILDPFLGSGTTIEACKELGRKFIGIEISQDYCDIANRRLTQEVFPF